MPGKEGGAAVWQPSVSGRCLLRRERGAHRLNNSPAECLAFFNIGDQVVIHDGHRKEEHARGKHNTSIKVGERDPTPGIEAPEEEESHEHLHPVIDGSQVLRFVLQDPERSRYIGDV